MKKFLGRLFALSLVIAATATAPVPTEAATCPCTVADRNACRMACSGCYGQAYCEGTTCVCSCYCG